jgi:hypothetical protein
MAGQTGAAQRGKKSDLLSAKSLGKVESAYCTFSYYICKNVKTMRSANSNVSIISYTSTTKKK